MSIECINCGQVIPEDDLNRVTRIAQCPHCDAIFDFSDQVETTSTERVLNPPNTLQVEEIDGGVVMAIKWTSWRAVVFMFGGLVVALGPIMLLDVVGGADQSVGPLIGFALFIIFLIGLAIVYYGLAQYVNSTFITVNSDQVRVQHKPLPLPGNRQIPAETISNIVTIEQKQGNQYETNVYYDVQAELNTGAQHWLVRGLKHQDEAHYIYHQLRRYLKLDFVKQEDAG